MDMIGHHVVHYGACPSSPCRSVGRSIDFYILLSRASTCVDDTRMRMSVVVVVVVVVVFSFCFFSFCAQM